jgi:hypothetical protein
MAAEGPNSVNNHYAGAADQILETKVEPGSMRSPFDHASQIHLLESGADGGRFSAVIPGWVGDYTVMTKQIA